MNYDECVDWCEFKWIINRPFAGHLGRSQRTHTHSHSTHDTVDAFIFRMGSVETLVLSTLATIIVSECQVRIECATHKQAPFKPGGIAIVCQKEIKSRNNLGKALTDNDSSKMTMRRNLSPNASVYLQVRCKGPYTIRIHVTWVRNSNCEKNSSFIEKEMRFPFLRFMRHIYEWRSMSANCMKKKREIHACSSRHAKLKCMKNTLRDDIAVVGEGYIGWFIRL